MPSARQKGPVALVTGGATGIGRATVEALAEAGSTVVIDHLGQAGPAAQLAGRIGGHAFEADVADAAAVDELVSRTEAELGPIGYAVCSAGFVEERPIELIDDAAWERTLRVLLGGCVNVVAALGPRMAARGRGSIVTIASELALVGAAEHAAYVAAKAAVIGFSQSVARELAPSGVRVNVVAPGPTDTTLLTARWRSREALASIPLGRLGTPEEIAETVVAVLRDPFLVGQVVSPNGGAVIQ